MTEIHGDVLELLKRHSESGQVCELVKRSEWSYSFKSGPKIYGCISRFLAEKDFEVSASEIKQRWRAMSQRKRMDFASNWWCKRTWTDDDTEILELIMADGDDHVWQCCTQAFLKHPDRDRAVGFLLERVSHYDLDHEPLNYIQVLGMSKDRRAVAAIRPYYEKYRDAVEAEAIIGIPQDVIFGPIPYHAFLATCGALFQIDGSSEYKQGIRKYFSHPSEQVRWWAEHALGIEGPTTTKRDTERRNKQGKQ